MKMRHKTWLFAATSALALATAGAVSAQSGPIPPEHYTLDPRGVDLVSGEWHPTAGALSVGPADTGLSSSHIRLENGVWWDRSYGGVRSCGIGVDCIVTVDGMTEVFTSVGFLTFAPKENTGSTLVYHGTAGAYTYTRSDGTIYEIGHVYTPNGEFEGLVKRRIAPNGLVTTYNYKTQSYCAEYNVYDQCSLTLDVQRLQSYQTNTGYQIHYDYVGNADAGASDWNVVQKVTALNLAVDYCAPTADTCSGLTRTWPSVAFSTAAPAIGVTEQIFTDQNGTQTRYRLTGGEASSLLELLHGSDPDPLISVTKTLEGLVTSTTDAGGIWSYSFHTTGAIRTATVNGPLDQKQTVVSDLTIGRATSVTQATGPSTNRTWTYAYDAGLRLDTMTNPEGDSVELDYDGRGNVTQVIRNAKPGSGLADIVTSTAYLSTCSNPVTCNLPTSSTDANGGVTNYSWDSTHGGLLSVTAPAPSTGAARPQTRITYAAQTAQFKNSSGVIVAAPTSVTLPVEISACATGTSCDGAANEVLTTFAYGATGVANNLQVSSVSRGSGTNPAMAVTAMTYTPDGDVQTVDGPLSGAADTTRYRYDDKRRTIGVVGPDPDGVGAGLNRARRITYGEHGQVLSTEVGVTAGYSDTDWANFDPILKTAATYDAFERPVEVRQLSDANAVSSVQQTTYDAAGRPSCVALRMNPATYGALPSSACTAATDGAYGPDRIVQMTYDAAGRPVSTTSAYGTSDAVTESVTYTANGQTASLTDGQGNVSVMEYDGFDRSSKLRYPNATGGGTSTTDYEHTTYDATGRPYSARNRAGDLTYFGYDALNRLVTLNLPSGTPDINSAYDNLGRKFSTGDGTITVNTTWDALSRPVSEASSVIGAMDYQYDAAGRLTRIEWPDDFAANYSHDTYGAITAIEQHPAGGSASQVAAYAWNDLGQPTGVSRAGGAGASSTYGYDAWSRMTSLAHDATGSANDVTFGFGYNPAGQIVGRTVSNNAYIHSASATGATAYAVDGQNQLDTIDSVAVTHDGRGNVTGALGRTYGYDDANRLTSANAGAGAAAFTFDPMNRLATSTVGGASTRRQYVGDQLVAEYNVGTGALTRRYIPGLGLDDVAATYDGAGVSNRSWQLADERGSVIAQSGATGAVSNINTYDEYGVPASGNTGRFQYTGQQWLPEAGAYHYRARTYLPQVGRFLQTDPIGYSAGANLYGYVGGDPVNFTDPTGLQEFRIRLYEECTRWATGQITHCSDVYGYVNVPMNVFYDNDQDSTSGASVIGGGANNPGGPDPAAQERCLAQTRAFNEVMAALPAGEQRHFRESEMFNSTSALLAERENQMDYYRYFSGANWVSGAYAAYSAAGPLVNQSVVRSPMGQRNGYTGNGYLGRSTGARPAAAGAVASALQGGAVARTAQRIRATEERVRQIMACGVNIND
jgi:RHS repeat-associated protein